MKKIIVLLMLGVSFMLAAINLQTASKSELMNIKGIGQVKADQIIKYRKSNKINSASDLQNIKGFGPAIIANVKGNKTVKKEMNKKTDKVKKQMKTEKTEKMNYKSENKSQNKVKKEINKIKQ